MTAHPIGATVRVRDGVQSRHAGKTGTVTQRLDDLPTEPRPVLVRVQDGATALYADADLELVTAPKREMLHDIEPNPHPARAWHAATPPVVRERLPYEELRKRYGVGDIVYWGRRVLGFERDDPMTCPNCDPLATENAALRERVARLGEEVLAYHADFMRREYGYDCTNRAELMRRAYAEADHIIDGDLDAAPGGEGGTDGQ